MEIVVIKESGYKNMRWRREHRTEASQKDDLRERGSLNVILLCNGGFPCKANSVSKFSSLRMMTQRVLYQASRYINTQTHTL